ncbi:DUF2284 domain-containing protein [Clostridium sp. Mt-5]|uniref:DUF2284 domain-containing protein n=1 Tax=Clostridium moutaii TaxID=3240932 RepID=A0ABV4BS46_9CLOT
MKANFDNLVKEALKLNVHSVSMVDTSKIKFSTEYRNACESNVCGMYDTNWMGPPAVGPIEELIDKARQYRQGILIQTVHELSDLYDTKAVEEAEKSHNEVFGRIVQKVKNEYGFKDTLPLSVGCCKICKRCAYLDGEKCRNPDKTFSSLEAYGINVMELEESCGMSYYNGENSISYVGLILFNED